jgi:hypothetical protein
MSEHLCCARTATSMKVAWFGFGVSRWIVPSAILFAIPKCPLCFAAYVTLVTGAGVSLTTASYLRVILTSFCLGLLVCLAARSINRVVKRRATIRGRARPSEHLRV